MLKESIFSHFELDIRFKSLEDDIIMTVGLTVAVRASNLAASPCQHFSSTPVLHFGVSPCFDTNDYINYFTVHECEEIHHLDPTPAIGCFRWRLQALIPTNCAN